MSEDKQAVIIRDEPIPNGRRSKYPFEQLDVGQSFFVPEESLEKRRRMVSNLLGLARRRQPKHFRCRMVSRDGIMGVQCWRTA